MVQESVRVRTRAHLPTLGAGILLLALLLLATTGLAVGSSGQATSQAIDGAMGGPQSEHAVRTAETGVSTAQSVDIERSRNETVVGTPVTFRRASGDATGNWTLTGPEGSNAELHEGQRGTVRLQPDVAGSYQIQVETERGIAVTNVTARERNDLIAQFAPRLHFHEDAPYRPTRIETIVDNAALRTADGNTVEERPTVFDLANRDGSHYLELTGSESDYPSYQDAYPPTVYSNYVPNVTYDGESYDVINYWFVYTYDPKHGFAQFGSHQGDVEWTSVLVDQNGEGAYVLSATHGGGNLAPYDQYAEDGRVDLYPEHRSQATYLHDVSASDGNGLQVYDFWGDGSAGCGETAYFESIFYSEWTGSNENWDPTGESGIEYDLVELTGDELWASYEGGFNSAPGSITGPHQRDTFDAPANGFTDACPVSEQISGSLSVDSFDEESNTVDVTVENDGGKPHEFWVTLEDGDEVLSTESVRVGTTRWELVDATARTTLSFEEDRDTLSVELWLYPPETRQSGDHEQTVTIEDGNILQSDRIPLWIRVLGGVAVVTLFSIGYRRRVRAKTQF